jgi:hypothetical protein
MCPRKRVSIGTCSGRRREASVRVAMRSYSRIGFGGRIGPNYRAPTAEESCPIGAAPESRANQKG